MPLTVGTHLGSYEILSLLGAGGMGEVYRARDTRLHREVALKILPELFALDSDRLARFEREAQVLASLNHPHIGAIHGLEESNGVHALVLELVEGPTLADVIAGARGSAPGSLSQASAPNRGEARQAVAALSPSERNARARAAAGGAPDALMKVGPHGIPIDEALPIARQIADALEAAHEHGITHRDLKPSNIKLTPTGNVKVLDFGLAKLGAREVSGAGVAGGLDALSNSPTMSVAGTQPGVILGTAAYMSPEQARGEAVDKRTDIWAFGCVLYEMLTGRRTFGGDDVTDVLAFIITKEPDWSVLPANTPATIRRLLRRCLQKDRKRRLADIADAQLEIEEALTAASVDASAVSPAEVAVQRSRWQRALPWTVASVLGVGLALVLMLWAPWRTAPPAAPLRLEATLGADASLVTNEANQGAAAVLSPDGAVLAFVAQKSAGGTSQLYVRRLEQLQAAPLSGTDEARSPFFSPDGQWIAFFAGGKLKKISATGGAAVTLCDAPNGRGGEAGLRTTRSCSRPTTPPA